MKRRNLCNTKRVMAVILSASMVMSSGVAVMAEVSNYVYDDGYVDVEAEDGDDITVSVESATGVYASSDAYDDGGSAKATVTVDNDVSTTDEYGAYASSYAEGKNSQATTTVEVGGNVSTTESTGVQSYSYTDAEGAQATSTVKVGGDVSTTYEYGVDAGSYTEGKDSQATSTVEVGGNVSTTGEYGIYDYSNADSYGSTGTTNVTVGGDVSVTRSDYNAGYGIYSYSDPDGDGATGTTNVTVFGDVTTEAYYGQGIYASAHSYGDDSKATEVISVGGNVSAIGSGYATGINVSTGIHADGSITSDTITVGGNVSAVSDGWEALGISADASGKGATTEVTVGKDLAANAPYYAAGIEASGYYGGSSDVTVGGNVDVESQMQATGVSLGDGGYSVRSLLSSSSDEYPSGKTNVVVNGNVTVKATGLEEESEGTPDVAAYGISGYGVGDASVNVGGDLAVTSAGKAEGINIEGVTGTVDITVEGNVKQEGSDGWAIRLADSSDGNLSITVGEDVKATTTAVNIIDGYSATDGSVDLAVEGTISGGEYNIRLDHRSTLDDMTVTVWKVDTSDNKNVVDKDVADWTAHDNAKDEFLKALDEAKNSENYDYSKLRSLSDAIPEEPESKYAQDKDSEKKINYIIRVQSDVSIESGTRIINGYDTARQDETVTFAVTVPSGYEIENFFNVSPGNIINLSKGSVDGTYYLTVPRGGGVDVGVSLKKIEQAYSGGEKESDNDGAYWSPDYNRNGNSGGAFVVFGTSQLQGFQVHAMSIGGDVVQNITDVLTPVDTITAMNNFAGTSIASIDLNNVMGAGVINFNDLFVNSISDTVDVPVPADVYANQSYTVMFSDGTSMVVTCVMNGVLNIPFSKNAKGLTYIIYKTEVNPTMFMGMPEATGWTY